LAESNQIRHSGTPRHEAIVDWELLNPGDTRRNCALALGISECGLSIIYNSDAFIDYRSRRMREHQALVSESVIEKTEAVAKISLDILEERFDQERKVIPLGGVKDTAEMALKALGFGQPRPGNYPPGGGNVTVIVGASPEQLAQARDRMKTINATVVEEEPTPDKQVAP